MELNTPYTPYDSVIQEITNYVFDFTVTSPRALQRARVALLDSIGCAIESLPACSSFIGPVSTGQVANGFPLPGCNITDDLLKATFDLGALIRYLDHNDAFPGAEWGHPSDNIGAILPVAYWLNKEKGAGIQMRDILEAIVKAYEIQGCFQIKNAFNKVGIDHVVLVKVASTAVVSKLMGLDKLQISAAISQAFADGQPLRVYRQYPNTSPRKGWAAGDACMRAVHLALMTQSGQPGFPTVLTDPSWGFYNTNFDGKPFALPIPFGSLVVENLFIKLVAAEGHGITAVEGALELSRRLQENQSEQIKSIHIKTQESAMRIIDKTGPLYNAADRDHCMRYMVAVTLLKRDWPVAHDYEDSSKWATDPRVHDLRSKITMEEDPQMTADYLKPNFKEKKCASALILTLVDGTIFDVLVELPLGYAWRDDTIPRARDKFLGLVKPILRDRSARIWDETMMESISGTDVCEWTDQFILRKMN